jgi:cobalt-zinc-cadmium efflux system membrane fusion protein
MAYSGFRSAPALIGGLMLFSSLTACTGGGATDNAAVADNKEAKPGEITLSADNMRRLGLRFEAAGAASEAPIAVVPTIIAPPPNARVAVAATFPGVVTRTLVVEGETVRKGQALAVVSSRDVLVMGADLHRAQARLGVARSNASRLSQLDREGVIAGARAEEARAALGEARADVSEKSRILHMVNASGGSGTYTLTAPIAGKVTTAQAHAGTVVDGSTAPYVIDADGQYEAQAQLPERLAGQVRPGMAVMLDGGLRGTVTAVGSTIDPATRSVTLKAKLPAGPGALAGRATNLSIFGPAPSGAVSVPQAALSTIGADDIVFVRTPDGVSMRRVKAGGKDGDRVLILSGLKVGEQIVVAGTSALKPMAMGE